MIFVPNEKTITLASRKSDLARIQAYTVGKKIEENFPDIKVKYHFRESLGDVNLNDPLWKMPEKGVFTEDFYQDLVQHKVDLVVHSWKDLPVEDKDKTVIAGTLDREDLRDVLLFKKSSLNKSKLEIFTSSPRRIYNLQNFFSWSLPWKTDSLEFLTVRGNIQTRVRKLLESSADGLIVAKAALDRLLTAEKDEFKSTKEFIAEALKDLNFQVIPLSQNPTAAAQGALAIEVAKDRPDVLEIISVINNKEVYHNVSLERNELKKHGGGCHQKIGISILTKEKNQIFFLKGLTDQGVVLNSTEVRNSTPLNELKALKSKNLSQELKKSLTPVAFQIPERNNSRFIFITKNENIISALKKHDFIWCSGVETWKSLARSGVWVLGCFDSLGEDKAPEIENLVPDSLKANWIKITHAQGKENFWSQKLATYEVNYQFEGVSYDDSIEFYYWSHGELFKKYFEKFPQIKNKKHGCGLGHTYQTLKNYIPEKQIYPLLKWS